MKHKAWCPWITTVELGDRASLDRRTHTVLGKVQVRLFAAGKARVLSTARNYEHAWQLLATSLLTEEGAVGLPPVPTPWGDEVEDTAGVHEAPRKAVG